MQKTDLRILSLMSEKINRLIEISKAYTDDEIKSNYMCYDTIQFEFEKLYEDFTKLSAEFRMEHKSFPSDQLRGIRNRVAHDYESVIVQVLIDTIRNDLPTLKKTIESIIEEN